ncbi:MAG: ABC transporter substrate-binding protein [Chloroflexota bacterium]|nr:MAG: ABC transporter substrate-binding protein [Chloroflexota bacterium]
MPSRRKGLFLAPIIVAVLLVGSLGGGCTSNTPATSAPKPVASASAPSAEQPTGELKIAMATFSKEVLDPTLDNALIKPIIGPIYDYLVGADVNSQLSKDYGLARDWKIEQRGNSSVYTFDLRQGVRFHDGTEATGQDVKFSLEYFLRPESTSGGSANLRGVIDRIEVPAQNQVVVYTKKPYAFLLTDLSPLGYQEGMVLPKAYIEKNGTDYFNKHPVGTGPYRFKEQIRGTSVTYEAIDYKHWLQQPKYKTVTLMLVPEESTRIAMLKTKEADVIDSVTTANLSNVEAAGLKAFNKKGSSTLILLLGQTWDEGTYLNDVRVREALNLAVDRQATLDQIFKKAGSISGAWYGSWANGYKPMPLYEYDSAKAKSLLQQAIKDKGWGKVELTFYSYPRPGVPEAQLVVEAVAGMWQKTFGDLINVQVVPASDFVLLRQKLIAKKAQNSIGVLGAPNSPFWGTTWRAVFTSKANYVLATTPQLDALIDQLGAETDIGKVGPDQLQIAQYLRDNHFVVPLFELDELYAANPQKVTNWETGRFDHDPNYRDILVRERAYQAQ